MPRGQNVEKGKQGFQPATKVVVPPTANVDRFGRERSSIGVETGGANPDETTLMYRRFVESTGTSIKQALGGFKVSPEEIGRGVTEAQMVEAYEMLDDAVAAYIRSPYYPGSRDYDPEPEGMVMDAYALLGLSQRTSYDKMCRILDPMMWEGPDYDVEHD